MPIGADFVYPDPKTPAHLRDVLRTIRSISRSTNDQIGPTDVTFDSAASVGQIMYVTSAGNVELANAGDIATAEALVMVSTAASANASGAVQRRGKVTLSDWSAVIGPTNLTPGAVYFLSTTNGQMTTTAPSTRGEVIVQLGEALSTTAFDLNIQAPVLL